MDFLDDLKINLNRDLVYDFELKTSGEHKMFSWFEGVKCPSGSILHQNE